LRRHPWTLEELLVGALHVGCGSEPRDWTRRARRSKRRP
jgi:hypothetical protein